MYVATRGGERAIAEAHNLLRADCSARIDTESLQLEQIEDQLSFLVARVMTEGSVYDTELAARAIRQAQGDLVEAIFLVRAFRATLPRFGTTLPINTTDMRTDRRISAVFKDVPGGQILGPTFDYTHRLIDFERKSDDEFEKALLADPAIEHSPIAPTVSPPRVLSVLQSEGLIEPVTASPEFSEGLSSDLTRQPLAFPASRPLRLQALARANEGFLLGLGYSTQRGFGTTHPFAGEIRMGTVEVVVQPQEVDFPICIGEIRVTECEMVNQFEGSATDPPQFTRGYGIGFGSCERKVMSMALVDRAMRAAELGEPNAGEMPAQDVEFVISHCDTLEASGFVEHLKLPHYVDFQSELALIRQLRSDHDLRTQKAGT
jgi:alpha-D-ribose 1-methylphosphonate 5-triphosphate synthase subunit PhnI